MGRSSPSCALTRATSSGVARLPSIEVAGPPGMRRTRRKTTTLTPRRTGTIWTRRLARYRRISGSLRADPSVDGQGAAGDEARLVGAQVGDRSRHVLGQSDVVDGRPLRRAPVRLRAVRLEVEASL